MRTRRSSVYIFGFILLILALTACVGPVTPFGALDSLQPVESEDLKITPTSKNTPVQIVFKPKKQVLHSKSQFVVEVRALGRMPELRKIKFFYNSLDVTKKLLAQAETKQIIKNNTLQITFDDLRLKVTDQNSIQVTYDDEKIMYANQLEAPSCTLFDEKSLNNIQGFQPPDQFNLWVKEISRQSKINPSLLTGIVAQESGFNPQAVSYAKAIGLTQITKIAEEQIRIVDKKWPQSREISSLNYLELKSKVKSGEINGETEWRLNPQKSLQGGADYINYLHSYWSTEEAKALLKKIPGDPDVALSRIILASYNSGAARVKNAIQKYGEKWLQGPELQEAHKYVNKVFSYCYHFSERSVSDDG